MAAVDDEDNAVSTYVTETEPLIRLVSSLRVPAEIQKQFHDFSMIFHDQQCNFHDYIMHGLQPLLLAASPPR